VAIAEVAGDRYAEAEPLYQRSLAILEDSSPPNYPVLIEVLDSYALLLIKTERKAEAELVGTRVMVYRAKLKNSTGRTKETPVVID
jgi:hypothetical protein